MRERLINWGLFIVLCFIWGSSFMLMKIGNHELDPYHVASLRIFSAGLVLLPFAFTALKTIPRNKIFLAILSGLLGSFFPAYLFTIAQTKIDSSLAGILNALTPLFTIIIGVLFFKLKAARNKWLGIIIGFIGLGLLPFAANKTVSFNDLSYAFLILLATIFYGVNVNMVGKYLKSVNSINIAALAFVFLMIPSAIILYTTGYFDLDFSDPGTGTAAVRRGFAGTLITAFSSENKIVSATAASVVLGVLGTAVASTIFYMLLKRAGALFASTVTYGIPFVAIFWGLIDNETITVWQVGCLGIILSGVYLANRN